MTQKPEKKYKSNNRPTGRRSASRRTSVIMPEALWAKLKLISMDGRTTINDVIVSAMTEKYGTATESEIRKIVPGTKKIIQPVIDLPKTTQAITSRPWENCVINTHAMEIPEIEMQKANPGKGQPKAMDIFRKAFKIKSGNSSR
jgi:hypothetical protein